MNRLRCYLQWIFRANIPPHKVGKVLSAVKQGQIEEVGMEFEFDKYLDSQFAGYIIFDREYSPSEIIFAVNRSQYNWEKENFIKLQIQTKKWINIEGQVYKAADIKKFLNAN